jgi:hypothetical protein
LDRNKEGGARIRTIEYEGRIYDLPSVTTILQNTLASPSLVSWRVKKAAEDIVAQSMMLYKEVHDGPSISGDEWKALLMERVGDQWADRRIALRAAALGTKIHRAIQSYIENMMVGSPIPPIEEEVAPAFNSWLQWMQTQDEFRPIAVESMTYSIEHQFSGQYDCKAWHNGRLKVFDWKTGNSLHLSHRFQLAAYVGAEKERGDKDVSGACVLRIPKTGGQITVDERDTIDLLPLAIDNYFEVFKTLRRIYKMQETYGE